MQWAGLARPALASRFRALALAALAASALVPAQAAVVISEIQYDPVGGSTNEFVELFNAGTNAVPLGGWFFADGVVYSFPADVALNPGGYLVVAANRAAFAARYPGVTNLAPGSFSGQLSNQGERLALADGASNFVFAVTYNNKAPWPEAAAGLGSSLVLIDPSGPADAAGNWQASAELNGSPGGPGGFFVRDVVINEVLAHTDPPQEDAVELRNLTTNPVSVAGWYLSDDNTVRKKYRFPAGTMIPPSGYLVVYQQQMMGTNSLVPFSISSKGDDVFLSEANGSDEIIRYVDQVAFEPTKNGVSLGRYPDGADSLVLLSTPTFGVSSPATAEEFRAGAGARNARPWVGPVVINEIMYHPPETNVTGRMGAEYVELLNTSGVPVPLYNPEYPDFTWSLTGGISYSFPSNTVLNPGQLLLVIGTNDVGGFRQSWGLPANATILGPFSNQLNNAGDTVRLRAPNNPELPDNIAAYHIEDEVKYKDQLAWPLAADGLGGSLERTDPMAYGNVAGNWHSLPSGGTPGRTNSVFVPPGSVVISEFMAVNRSSLQDEDGDASDWIELYNTTDHAVSLGGWHLTDQPSVPALWTFPAVTIAAHAYLVVFASQKNRTNDVTRLHTNFALDEAGEYLALVRDDLVVEFAFDPAFPPQADDVGYGIEFIGSPVGTVIQAGSPGRCLVPASAPALASNWTARTFDDSAWQPAGNGIGYDTDATYLQFIQTDLRGSMFSKTPSAFVRYPFYIENSATAESMLLRVKYDDGFAAWLNGVLVASNNVPASLAWDSLATANRSDALAVAFENYNLAASTHLLADGVNVLALQVLNTTIGSSDLLLLPELQVTWSGQTSGVSFVAGYLSPATPSGMNGAVLPGVAPMPLLSHPGGVFSGSLSVTVTCANAQADIRYTLDGTVPTAGSMPYTAPLEVTSNTELLVRAFVPGWVPSGLAGAVYRTTFLGINEILADNVTSTPEMADFTDFGDWIELYNAGTNDVSLSGYYLSDNLDQPFRWRVPDGTSIAAGGYLLVWCDGYDSYPGLNLTRPFWPYAGFTTRSYHSNFKLSAAGEAVGLFSPSGSRIDAVTFGLQTADISCGRYPDGGSQWGYFGEPTAGAANRLPVLGHNLHRAPPVTIAPTNDALIVTGAVQVVLTSDPAATEIRYTTNGALPTSLSPLYTAPFSLSSGGVVRARAYAPDRHPGPVATRTFLSNVRRPDLPIISLVIDPYLLFDPVRGIYANLLKEREVPGNFQLCTTPTNTAFQIDAGFRLYSLNTFLFAQKPLTVYLDGKYGYPELPYQLFPDKPIGFFDRFILRNGNDDWPEAFLRDTLGQQMLKGAINNALQGSRPCAIYLNGAYHGLINIQEKMDEMFCAKNYGVDLADIDFFENDGFSGDELLDAGTADGWNALLAYLGANSMSNPANYEYVKTQVDIEDLVDYVAGQVFVDDIAWAHNRKWWRDRKPGGRWRWCFVDLDRGLNSGSVNDDRISDMASSMVVFRELLNNTGFRAYCAQRLMAHLSSSFSTNRILPIIDREAGRIRSEMVLHRQLFGQSSIASWDSKIEEIRNYARQRPSIAMQHVASYFGAGQTAAVQVQVGGGAGRILANHVALDPGTPCVFVAGQPAQFTARPDIGQAFVRWEISGGRSETATLVAAGGVWRYADAVTNDIPGWAGTDFDDSAWASGAGQLGYGDGDETTTIGFGGDANSKLITAYFRKAVVVTNAASFDSLELGLLRDDGAIVYINGREVLRSNMPAGLVSRTTLAATSVGSPGENGYLAYGLSPGDFAEGTNVLAVEVHQSAANSSDLGFDLYLAGVRNLSSGTETNFGPQITITPSATLSVRAIFAPTGQSLLPGAVESNLTLRAAQSPYLATGDILVPPGASLTAEAGATILMPEGASIYVQGELAMLGTTGAPVRIACNPDINARRVITDSNLTSRGAFRWGCIAFDHATHTGLLSHVVIRGASVAGVDPANMKAAISARDSDLFMDGLDVDDVWLPVFVQDGTSAVLQNSRLRLRITGDVINLKRTQYARVENCEMSGAMAVDADAIDYDGIQGGIIRGNWLHDFLGDNDDAIDTGEGAKDLLIESNRVARFYDKGVSVGQGTTVIVRRNVIRDCGIGVGIKDAGSFGLVEHNTFHRTGRAVAVYEKNPGAGGGGVEVRNCILSGTVAGPVTIDPLSTGKVSYCLSDSDPISGDGNRTGEPQFENAKEDNFRLQAGSAAVDTGSPADPPDADGSRTDMGAIPFDWREGHAVITEIHYHPAGSNEPEFVELFNAGGAPLDLGGWQFARGVGLVFPAGTVIQPGRYLVIATDTNGVRASGAALAWSTGVLDNAGETIQLIDAASNEIDQVSYLPGFPWPEAAAGSGPSLSLINPRWNNLLPASWYASAGAGGTPGAAFDNLAPGPVSAQFGPDGAFRISAGGLPGLLYSLDFTENLAQPDWMPVASGCEAVDGQVVFRHATDATNGFFRIRVVLP